MLCSDAVYATTKSFCAGTGKTDTAVQIMHVLYANNPGQRVLLITHSNQALNDLFSKLLERCAGPFHWLEWHPQVSI